MFYEPLAGKRYVRITERHTMVDFAQGMKWLVDVLYPRCDPDPGGFGQSWPA